MESDFRDFSLRVICAALGSICIGFMFFNTSIFFYSSPAFQFIVFGIFGGIILATTRVTTVPKSFVVIGLATLFNEIILTPFGKVLIIRDMLFLAGIGSTLVLFQVYFHKHLRGIRLARPLVLGAMLALNAIFISAILHLIIPYFFEGNDTPFGALFANLSLGFLFGIGLGIGDEMREVVTERWGNILQSIYGQLSPKKGS